MKGLKGKPLSEGAKQRIRDGLKRRFLNRRKHKRNEGHTKEEIAFKDLYGCWPTGTMLHQYLENRPKPLRKWGMEE